MRASAIKVAFIVSMAAFLSCEREEPTPPAPTCAGIDTLQITYTADIASLMRQHCTSCHSGASPGGGMRLETYDQVRTAAARCYDQMSRGKMPPGGKLDDCTIARFKRWIDTGYPQ